MQRLLLRTLTGGLAVLALWQGFYFGQWYKRRSICAGSAATATGTVPQAPPAGTAAARGGVRRRLAAGGAAPEDGGCVLHLPGKCPDRSSTAAPGISSIPFTQVVDKIMAEYPLANGQNKAALVLTPPSMGAGATIDQCDHLHYVETSRRNKPSYRCSLVGFSRSGHQETWQAPQYRFEHGALARMQVTPMSRREARDEAADLERRFFNELPQLRAQFRRTVADAHRRAGKQGEVEDVVVMVANSGVVDILMNFVCSARQAQIDISNVVVFISSDTLISTMEAAGLTYIYNEGFGSFPENAAGGFGDRIFTRMMWLKVTSVFVALTAGYNVLFQDADLVWFREPWKYLHGLEYDVSFMDDGARSSRHAPFFANSGYYFFRKNDRAVGLMQRFIHALPEILAARSHQTPLTRYLIESYVYSNLSVLTLDRNLFPSGAMYHHRKAYMADLKAGKNEPFVFHMCWTANRIEKLRYFRDAGMWHVEDSCSEKALRSKQLEAQHGSGGLQQRCCKPAPQLDTFLEKWRQAGKTLPVS